MLCLDFPAAMGRGGDMDDDTHDLIVQLCTRIVMIMEDTSVVALTIGGLADEARWAAIVELEAGAVRVSALVNAAKSLAA